MRHLHARGSVNYTGARYMMVARNHKRSADHACTIAEVTAFMQTGGRVEIR